MGEVVQLGDGLEMWYGIFQSAILGWKPFVNVDGKWVVTLLEMTIHIVPYRSYIISFCRMLNCLSEKKSHDKGCI